MLSGRPDDQGVPALSRLQGKRVFVSHAKIAAAISDRMYPGSWGVPKATLGT